MGYRRMIRLLFALSFLVVFSPVAAKAADITVEQPYAFATAPMQKNGAAFMVIHNSGETADKVIGAEADISERVELHTHIMDGDRMMMRQVESYDLPAGGQTVLKPMSHHIMFMDLKTPLKEGDSFPLTLKFENHDPVSTSVKIVKPGQKAPHNHKHGGHEEEDDKDGDTDPDHDHDMEHTREFDFEE